MRFDKIEIYVRWSVSPSEIVSYFQLHPEKSTTPRDRELLAACITTKSFQNNEGPFAIQIPANKNEFNSNLTPQSVIERLITRKNFAAQKDVDFYLASRTINNEMYRFQTTSLVNEEPGKTVNEKFSSLLKKKFLVQGDSHMHLVILVDIVGTFDPWPNRE